MAIETTWVGHGAPAAAALEAVLAEVRAGDPLAPATVITPSPAVAVALRRHLARRTGGMGAVTFADLGAVAELVAAPAIAAEGIEVGLDHELLVAAVRVALETDAGSFEPIVHHRTTWEAVARAVAELGDLSAAGRAEVAASTRVAADLVRVHDDVADRLGPLGTSRVLALATRLLADGAGVVDDLGPVVVHLPRALSALEVRFLAALGARVPMQLLLGTVGRSADDDDLAARLAPLGVPAPPTGVEPPVVTRVLAANDVDDEVRVAIRSLLARAEEADIPLHRMALVHPGGAPYARVVADVLDGASIPWSGPSTATLAQTAPGRVLLAMLDVARSGFGRQEVVDLWSTGVIRDPDGPLPFARYDDLSRRLGIIRGADRWADAVDRALERAQASLADAEDDDDRLRLERRADDLRRLGAAVDRLRHLVEARPTTWDAVAEWAAAVVDTWCGPAGQRASWPDHELAADESIRVALGRLEAIARVEPTPDPARIDDAIRAVLEAPAPRRGASGTGVLVTTPERPPVVPLDAVAVVGLVEGQLPRTVRDDVLIGEELRDRLGLALADDRVRSQRAGIDAALASAATERIVCFARNDQRSGRSQVPSRWLIDAVEQRTGERPAAEDLMTGREVPGVEVVASATASLRDVAEGRSAALDGVERRLAALVVAGALDGVDATDDALAAGVELARSRAAGAFTRFDGDLAGDGVDIEDLGILSPTSLEDYATCPRRWFFGHVLRLGETDRPERIDRIPPRDRGSLAHAVLEDFFDEAMRGGTVPAPGLPWPESAHDRLDEIAARHCDELEARGRTGHPRWWAHDRAEIVHVLHDTLRDDARIRAHFGGVPVSVEFTFGRRDEPPLEVPLGDGRVVRLSGQADRVDRAGDTVLVWDYKYASPSGYADLTKDEDRGGDPLGYGAKLQLVAYAMAAADDTTRVFAHYWFLRPECIGDLVGYEVDEQLRERFRRVLRVIADGLADGRFPARPGEHQWHRGTFAHCSWCDFDAICPADRDVEWQRVRLEPRLRAYRTLVEDGSRTVLDPATEVTT